MTGSPYDPYQAYPAGLDIFGILQPQADLPEPINQDLSDAECTEGASVVSTPREVMSGMDVVMRFESSGEGLIAVQESMDGGHTFVSLSASGVASPSVVLRFRPVPLATHYRVQFVALRDASHINLTSQCRK